VNQFSRFFEYQKVKSSINIYYPNIPHFFGWNKKKAQTKKRWKNRYAKKSDLFGVIFVQRLLCFSLSTTLCGKIHYGISYFQRFFFLLFTMRDRKNTTTFQSKQSTHPTLHTFNTCYSVESTQSLMD
jgi:hypothetical protein